MRNTTEPTRKNPLEAQPQDSQPRPSEGSSREVRSRLLQMIVSNEQKRHGDVTSPVTNR